MCINGLLDSTDEIFAPYNQVGATRVVGNPAGYLDADADPGSFRPDRVAEISL